LVFDRVTGRVSAGMDIPIAAGVAVDHTRTGWPAYLCPGLPLVLCRLNDKGPEIQLAATLLDGMYSTIRQVH
jgi:hypothetical protein